MPNKTQPQQPSDPSQFGDIVADDFYFSRLHIPDGDPLDLQLGNFDDPISRDYFLSIKGDGWIVA